MSESVPNPLVESSVDEGAYWRDLQYTRANLHLLLSVLVYLHLQVDLVVVIPVEVFYPLSEVVVKLKALRDERGRREDERGGELDAADSRS